MSFVKPVVLACTVALMGIPACTHVHNETPRGSGAAPDKVDVHVHDSNKAPDVNIKVEDK